MTKGNPKWEQFEKEVQSLLGLRSTPGSGNQWHDSGDARSYPDDPYRLMVDCKYTEKKSFSLNSTNLDSWALEAATLGFRFALPVRLDGDSGRDKDWVVVPIHDYAELIDAIRILNGPRRCGVRFQAQPGEPPCCRRAGHFNNHDNGKVEWAS